VSDGIWEAGKGRVIEISSDPKDLESKFPEKLDARDGVLVSTFRDRVLLFNPTRATIVKTVSGANGSTEITLAPLQFKQVSVTPTTVATPRINSGGIVIHVGVSPAVSPGSFLDIYGSNLAVTAVSTPAGANLPVTLGGVQVLVNGTPAPLIYVSAAQIIFQVPYETALGTASVAVLSNTTASAAAPMTVQQAAPSILIYGNNRAVVVTGFSPGASSAALNSPASPETWANISTGCERKVSASPRASNTSRPCGISSTTW
jgi:hypothetical protein